LLDLLRLSTASRSHERINIHHVSSFSKETMETSLAICWSQNCNPCHSTALLSTMI